MMAVITTGAVDYGNLNETEKWKKISINWRHQIRFWVVQTGYQIEPPATGKQDEMAEEKKTEEAAQSLAEHVRSRNHPDATLTAKGFTQLSSATNSTS